MNFPLGLRLADDNLLLCRLKLAEAIYGPRAPPESPPGVTVVASNAEDEDQVSSPKSRPPTPPPLATAEAEPVDQGKKVPSLGKRPRLYSRLKIQLHRIIERALLFNSQEQ